MHIHMGVIITGDDHEVPPLILVARRFDPWLVLHQGDHRLARIDIGLQVGECIFPIRVLLARRLQAMGLQHIA